MLAHGVVKGEQAIMEQLVQSGPLACGICSKKLEAYSGGVWYGIGKACSDHTISIAGYGSTAEGVPYWLVRNSWSVCLYTPSAHVSWLLLAGMVIIILQKKFK